MTWVLYPIDSFSKLAASWDTLQRCTTNTPFFESGFLFPLLSEFGTGAEMLAMHDGAFGVDAATILQPSGKGLWETFQPSQLPLGPWIAAPNADMPRLAHSLVGSLPGLAIGLGLTQLDPRLTPIPTNDTTVRTQDYIKTSFVDISGSFDDYWEARGKNLKQNTRKQRNKLQAENTDTRLEFVTDPADVAGAIDDFGGLESAGWKAGEGTAVHPNNAQGRFYRRMLENFCAEDRGLIVRYSFGSKVVSMDLCIDNGPVVVVLKTAYDESYKSISPSTLMRQDEFRRFWDDQQYRRIEFYGKTLEWHTRWTDTERQLYHATWYRWPMLREVHERINAWRSARETIKGTA